MKLTVAQLAERIGAELVGQGSAEIMAVAAVEAAGLNNVTFIADGKHIPKLEKSLAGAVIVAKKIEGLAQPQLVVKDVNVALVEALNIFAPKLKPVTEGIDPTAKVAASVKISRGVSVGPGAVIERDVEIGENTVIAAGCKIGQNSRLGKNSQLDNNVVIYYHCTIGNNVIIQANSTIGSTGFGYSFIDGVHRLIPHNGGVVIEDFVEIGANSCIDRAKFGNTVIGAGTKIDNLVQIAHNVIIGKCCLIAALVGISGSCRLGDGVVFGGQAGMADNIEIGDGVKIGGQSGVIQNITAGKQLFGTPAIDFRESLKLICLTRRLPKLVEQLKQLNNRIEKLEAAKDNKK